MNVMSTTIEQSVVSMDVCSQQYLSILLCKGKPSQENSLFPFHDYMSIKGIETKAQAAVGNACAKRNITRVYSQSDCECVVLLPSVFSSSFPLNISESPLSQAVC